MTDNSMVSLGSYLLSRNKNPKIRKKRKDIVNKANVLTECQPMSELEVCHIL